MRIIHKPISIITLVILLILLLPAGVTRANDTSIEVAAGISITMNQGDVISSTSSSIPVEIKNLPDMGAPDNGLAAFDIDFHWDPSVINVDKVIPSQDATASPDWGGAGWSLTIGNVNNDIGKVSVVGYNTNFFTDDITLLYFGITVVGNPGSATELGASINSFFDRDNIPITPVTPVSMNIKVAAGNNVSSYISVTPADNTITTGTNLQFTAKIHYVDGRQEDITDKATWSSSDTEVALVDTSGLVTGISEGISTIIADYGDMHGSVILTVIDEETEEDTSTEDDTSETPDVTEETDIIEENIEDIPVETEEPVITEEDTENTPVETEEAVITEEDKQETPVETEGSITDTPTDKTLAKEQDTDESESTSKLPIPWIIGLGGAVVVILVLLGYIFLRRRRY